MDLRNVKRTTLNTSKEGWEKKACTPKNLLQIGLPEADIKEVQSKYKSYKPYTPQKCYVICEGRTVGILMFEAQNKRTYLIVPKGSYTIEE